MRKRSLRATITVIVLVFSLIGTGCLGRFAAFNKLSEWNQKVTDNKFINEVIFLGLNIIPVYGIALLADAIVINSIEFWTGNNPMLTQVDHQKVVQSGDVKVVQTFHQDQEVKAMVTEYYIQGRLEQKLTLSLRADSPEFRGTVVTADGKMENFAIQAEDSKLLVTRFGANGDSKMEVVEGIALHSLSQKVAGLLNTSPTIQLASAH